jgi:hypothetical protein
MSIRWVRPASRARAVGLSGCLLLACVNRGMRTPAPDAGDGGRDRLPVADGADGGNDAAMDRSGAGGTIGTGGTGGRGTGGTGVGGAGTGGRIADAGSPDAPVVCSARFNFEGGALHGAFINTFSQTAFSNLVNSTDTACGNGALRMNVTIAPASEKGEVIIPLGGTEDLSGKTLSLSLKTTPAPGPNTYVLVFLRPSYTQVTGVSPIPVAFATTNVILPAGATANEIAIQLIGGGDTYTGLISIDEVDIR